MDGECDEDLEHATLPLSQLDGADGDVEGEGEEGEELLPPVPDDFDVDADRYADYVADLHAQDSADVAHAQEERMELDGQEASGSSVRPQRRRERRPVLEQMKKRIERAAELPEGQVLTISGHSVTRGQLLAAIQGKGMDDGNVV